MKASFARDELKTFIATFGGREVLFDSFDCTSNGIGSVGANIDLLNLNGGFEGASKVNINKNGIVEVDAIEVDGVIDFGKHTNDHELLTVIIESLSDGFGTAK